MKRRNGPKRRVTSRPDRYRVDPWAWVNIAIGLAAWVVFVVAGLIAGGLL